MMNRHFVLSLLGLCIVGALLLNITQFSPTQHKDDSTLVEESNTTATVQPSSDPVQFPDQPAIREDPTEACADCHPDHVEGFKQTGMGKSLYVIDVNTISEPWTIQASETKHPSSNLTYRVFKTEDGRFWQEETLPGTDYSRRLEAVLAIGSGNHTRSYLGWLDGTLIQLPLTYYFDAKRWDLSPGYDTNNLRMGRPITAKCLFCHNDLSKNVVDTTASYESPFAAGISCERCHGKGQEHVDYRMEGKEPKAGAPDPTILNPKHFPSSHQQQVCEQCHLQGRSRRLNDGHAWDTYDPKMPLHEYMTIFVERIDTDAFGIASHGARLQQSKCYESGVMGCSTCHNPHKTSTKAEYISDCKSCHEVGCKNEVHSNGYCPECHMPKGTPSDIPHVQFSDHFIRVAAIAQSQPNIGESHLSDPHAHLRTQTPSEQVLRMAIGHFDDLALQSSSFDAVSRAYVESNLPTAVSEHPTDWNGLDAVSQYHMAQRNFAQASTALETMSELRPSNQEVRLNLVRALALNGEKHRAKEILLKVPVSLRFLPAFGDALSALGEDLTPTWRGFLMHFTRVHPSNEEATLSLAQHALKSQLTSKALAILKKSLDNDPLQFKVLFLAANLAYDERDYRQAVTHLDRILHSNRTLDSARWLRSRCLRKLNRFDLSIADLEKLAHSQPQNEAILLDYFGTVAMAGKQSEMSERLKVLRPIIPAKVFESVSKKIIQAP
jgi:tetratricopeptide (TPR) repeat protein